MPVHRPVFACLFGVHDLCSLWHPAGRGRPAGRVLWACFMFTVKCSPVCCAWSLSPHLAGQSRRPDALR